MSSGATSPRWSPLLQFVAWFQAIFYLITGIWPLVSLETFEMVTGEKFDDWLVMTVGVLIAVTGGVILVSAMRKAIPFEIMLLAVGDALALAAIDITFVSIGRIAPIYLADAAAEAVLVMLWVMGWRKAAPAREMP